MIVIVFFEINVKEISHVQLITPKRTVKRLIKKKIDDYSIIRPNWSEILCGYAPLVNARRTDKSEWVNQSPKNTTDKISISSTEPLTVTCSNIAK